MSLIIVLLHFSLNKMIIFPVFLLTFSQTLGFEGFHCTYLTKVKYIPVAAAAAADVAAFDFLNDD